jgi:hypothetical protein
MLGGESISAPLPDLHLKDIGMKQGGVSPAEAFEEILEALYGGITSPAVSDALNQGLRAVGSGMETLGKGAGRELQSVPRGCLANKWGRSRRNAL